MNSAQPDRSPFGVSAVVPAGANRALQVVLAGWTVLYSWRSLVGHYSLNTNAYDLALFDYGVANLIRDGRGQVPFIGHSLAAEHFMPVLWVFAPIYRFMGSPAVLLMLQIGAILGAALLLARFCRGNGLSANATAAVVFVFLFARRTHGAAANMFYPEVFQAGLTIAMVMAWTARRVWLYWALVFLLLATKEDAGIYVLGFGCVSALYFPTRRKQAVVTSVVAAAWILFAVSIAIPGARSADGLPRENPLIQTRYGADDGTINIGGLARRLLSVRAAGNVAGVLATAGFLSLAAPVTLAPAVPGILINAAADPATMQAKLIDHYLWPMLPWLFMAAALGYRRFERAWPRVAPAFLGVLAVVTAADNPALQRARDTRLNPEAAVVRSQLRALEINGSVLAQANLIPHLRRADRIYAVGGMHEPQSPPEFVLMTEVGDLWPVTLEQTRELVRRYESNLSYVRVSPGPLFAYRLKRPDNSR